MTHSLQGWAVASLRACCITSPAVRRSEDAGHRSGVVRGGRGGQRDVCIRRGHAALLHHHTAALGADQEGQKDQGEYMTPMVLA